MKCKSVTVFIGTLLLTACATTYGNRTATVPVTPLSEYRLAKVFVFGKITGNEDLVKSLQEKFLEEFSPRFSSRTGRSAAATKALSIRAEVVEVSRVSGIAKFFLGKMAGSDRITAVFTVFDSYSKARLGSFTVTAESSGGAFSGDGIEKDSDKLVEEVSDYLCAI